MTSRATTKQIDYIMALANRITGRRDGYLSQIRDIVPLSMRQRSSGLSKAEASAIIDSLVAQVR